MAIHIKRLIYLIEYYVCMLVWSSSVIYSLYCYYFFSSKVQSVLDQNDFRRGWLNRRPKDISDTEWRVMSNMFLRYFNHVIGHICLSQLVQLHVPQYFAHFLIAYGTYFIISVFSIEAFLCILFNIALGLLIHLRLQKLFSYLFLFFILTSISYPDFASLKDYLFENDSYKKFLFEVSIVWLNARLLSFNLDRLNELQRIKHEEQQKFNSQHHHHQHHHNDRDDDYSLLFARNVKSIKKNEYILIFAYMFYVPTFFTGPISHYASFVKDVKQIAQFNPTKVLKLLLRIMKYAFWMFILEIALHYFYTTAIQYYPTLIYSLDAWTLVGFGYSLPCLFFIKYFIIYGLSHTFAEMDQISIPEPPKCVTRIHSSSLLWRFFDRGLYFWLKDYFYKPMISGNYNYVNKISASFICFTYVCLWHKMEDSAIFWCSINFIVIVIEQSFLNYLEENKVLNHYVNQLSEENRTRLNALVSAPFFAIMIISNIYFLSNVEVGNYFFSRVMFKWPVPSIPLLAIMYCACFYSINRATDLQKHTKTN